MSASQRRKGMRFQQWLARRWRDRYPAARSTGFGQAGEAGQKPPDVDGTPFYLELKHQAAPSVWSALKQAEEHRDHRPPVAICRRNGGDTVVVMRLETFESLLSEDPLSRPGLKPGTQT